MKKVLLFMGILTGFCLIGCSNNALVDSPAARAGSASDIKVKLASTQQLHNTKIEVNTQNGKNILSGLVYTRKQKFLAGSVARSVEGSGTVINRLEVQ